MTSITQQKADLKAILSEHMINCYISADGSDKLKIVTSIAEKLLDRMSLQELKEFHQKIVVARMMRERETT